MSYLCGAFAIGCGAFAVACSQESTVRPDGPVSRRDSAGVVIIENHYPTKAVEAGPALDSVPFLELGCRDCDDQHETFGHVSDVLRLDDGSVAVLDVIAREARVFSGDGTFQYSIGRGGQGPGELTLPDRMALVRGDSVVIHDQGTFQQHVYSERGEYGRSVKDARIPSWRGLWAMPRGWLPDGRYLIGEDIDTRKLPQSRGIASAEWRVMAADGSDLGVIAVLPAMHGETQPPVGGMVWGQTIFSPQQSWGVDSTGFWHAFPRTYEIRHITVEGRLDRIVRRSWAPEPIPPSLVSRTRTWLEGRFRDRAGSLPESGRRRQEAELASMVFADTLPAFRRIKVTRQGGLWVERYPRAEEIDPEAQPGIHDPTGQPEWSIFDPQGNWVGDIRLPDRLTIHEIGVDYVLGVWRDDYDVSFVRLYRLRL